MTLRAILRVLPGTLTATLTVGLCVTSSAAGWEDFRIENKIFVDGQKEPRIQSTTIFHAGVVYDYLTDPTEVTVFDAEHGRFVLLDLTRRIKTELTTDRVLDFCERLKHWAQEQPDPFLKFLGDPHFDEQSDESDSQLTFVSPCMTYRVTAVDAQSEAVARQYREFSDWYCRLNTFLNPGARPPFARMAVNAALAKRQQLPREVHLTIQPGDGLLSRRLNVRSEHLLIRQLLESDRKRIAQTDQFMAMYATVDFVEYQRKMAD